MRVEFQLHGLEAVHQGLDCLQTKTVLLFWRIYQCRDATQIQPTSCKTRPYIMEYVRFRLDRPEGLPPVPGLHDLRHAGWRRGCSTGTNHALHPSGARPGHQLLRHRRHVFAGRNDPPAGRSANTPTATWCWPQGVLPDERQTLTTAACRASTSSAGIDASLKRLGTGLRNLYIIHRFDPHAHRRDAGALDVNVRSGRAHTSAPRRCSRGSSCGCWPSRPTASPASSR